MVSLPGLNRYSEAQLEEARHLSPAFARYERLLKLSSIDPFHTDRHRAWMDCVLATYFATATTAEVCAHWTTTADRILRLAWQECGLANLEATLFALGKHGAGELNLSSDIDLLVVAESPDAFAVEKGLRRLQQRLHQPGEFGFCFRLDFDLRPGGKMGPWITTPAQFQDYYWSQGETWERLALVRLRAVVGQTRLDLQTLDLARRFSYRKFLDFTLLEDLKALRSQVHQNGFARRDQELHLKLEVGGIRDIELFVHSLLVLNGGKIPELQTPSTTLALQRLKAKNILSGTEADLLLESYWVLRHAENIVQSIEDRQTHSVTTPPPPVPALPATPRLIERMARVDQVVSSLLGQVNLDSVHLPQDLAAQRAWLSGLGFSSAAIDSSWEGLIAATALSHKNDRDERARQEFLFSFVSELAGNVALDRDLGLNLLLDFVRATRAKATFFTMLLRSPRLIQDLARIFCLSPYLGSIVASRPELLDHFILQVDESWAPDSEALLQQMSERKLLTELWAANQFLTDKDLRSMFTRITFTADSICRQLLIQLRREFPEAQLDILTLGKWGGEELGLRSDLDFIFVTPGPPNDADFKVARRFISRLSDPSKGGNLYDLDLRLRPSGQSGPLLVAIDKLYDYWQNFAAPWQRQAYLRARPLSQSMELQKQLLVTKALTPAQLLELRDIRAKLLRPPTTTQVDVKYAPGGLLDIEFVCQTAILNFALPSPPGTFPMIDALAGQLNAWRPVAPELKEIYLRLREIEQMLQLTSVHKHTLADFSGADFAKAAGLLGLTVTLASQKLRDLLDRSRIILNELDPTGLKI